VYCFCPDSGHIRVVANNFGMPNGIAFSPDGSICYITDTSAIDAKNAYDGTKGAIM
jgi:gluconolactonase